MEPLNMYSRKKSKFVMPRSSCAVLCYHEYLYFRLATRCRAYVFVLRTSEGLHTYFSDQGKLTM